jgi:hypothetical protein
MKIITAKNRASAALAAVKAYRNVHGSPIDPTDDMGTAIRYLVGDLCHLAAQHEIPPFGMLESSAEFYAAEAVEDAGDFLEVLVTLDVQARPVVSEEDGSEEDFQTFNDQSAASWRARAQVECARPRTKLTIVR